MLRTTQSVFAFDRFPAELRLMLRCVRWPVGTNAAEIRDQAASGFLDWDFFLLLCRHHRVMPLVYRGLSAAGISVPESTLSELKVASNENVVSAFRYISEVRRLSDLLEQAGISVRVLKGVPLSQAIFGDPGVRDVGDIDLLIPPGLEEKADRILLADGFYRHDPAGRLTPRRRGSWQKHGKDYTYRADRNAFEIDLHWRLFRNPYMPGNALADMHIPGEEVRFGEISLTVLPRDRSFLFLCVHGALDGWFRFKSLIDLAALWRGFQAEQRSALTEQARGHDILPEMVSALGLAQELRLLEDGALTAAMQLETGSREARWILDYARAKHVAYGFQPIQETVGSWALKRYELGLRRTFLYRQEILRRILLRPRMWTRFDLPDALFPLYPFLSPLEWFLFHRQGASAGKPLMGQNSWTRWRALSVSQKWLLAEAFAALLAARASLVLLPVRWIFRWLESPVRNSSAPRRPEVVERIRWAVLTVARYGPLSFVCFPQALAAHAMLRRRGIGSIMHYGVRRAADRRIRAHTWLEVDNRMLLGGESSPLFAPIHSTGVSSDHS